MQKKVDKTGCFAYSECRYELQVCFCEPEFINAKKYF